MLASIPPSVVVIMLLASSRTATERLAFFTILPSPRVALSTNATGLKGSYARWFCLTCSETLCAASRWLSGFQTNRVASPCPSMLKSSKRLTPARRALLGMKSSVPVCGLTVSVSKKQAFSRLKSAIAKSLCCSQMLSAAVTLMVIPSLLCSVTPK